MAEEMEKHVPLFEEWLAVNELSAGLLGTASRTARIRGRAEQADKLSAGATAKFEQEIGGVPLGADSMKVWSLDPATGSNVRLFNPKEITDYDNREVKELTIAWQPGVEGGANTGFLFIAGDTRYRDIRQNFKISSRRGARQLRKMMDAMSGIPVPFSVDDFHIREIHGA